MNKSRQEFIDAMIQNIHYLPMDQVMMNYCPSVDLLSRGLHSLGYCPFHSDNKRGSFVVTPSRNIWYCFTDNIGGDIIKFHSMLFDKNYLESAFQIAADYSVITQEEYEQYSRKKYTAEYVTQLESRYAERKKESKPKKASFYVCNAFYAYLQSNCQLSSDHFKQLEEVRMVSRERIAKDYFTFPTNWKQKDKLIESFLKEHPEISPEELILVPGCFYDCKRRKISFSGYRGIGILIRNIRGEILGIQIRKDVCKEGESRYVWFSSLFAFYDKMHFMGGCGCGSPKDVLLSENRGYIGITEGRFKSEELCKRGISTISIQGVSTWSGIEKTVYSLGSQPKQIVIFFDADLMGNYPLFMQSAKMCEMLAMTFPRTSIHYALWHKENGKGIDDFLHNGNQMDQIKYLSYDIMISCVVKIHKILLDKYGVTEEKHLTKSQKVSFQKNLQYLTEKYVL